MAVKRITNRQIGEYVANRMEFKANSTYAVWYTDKGSLLANSTLGRLPLNHTQLLGSWSIHLPNTFGADGKPLYIVYSYQTPIAWWNETHGWCVPDEKYSATTSCAQGRIRSAVGIPAPPRPKVKRTKKDTGPVVAPPKPTDWWLA